MKNVLDYFKIVSKTPRCSFKAETMKDKIVEIAKSFNFDVSVDKVGNVYCKKGNPIICLQAHYDMVCIGDTDNIKLVREGDILKAKNSTLGADNGMGMSIIFTCMQKYDNLECLFTSDEEVGLIGATNLEFEINSDKILNLDGEEESDIYVGCAGGIDIVSTLKLKRRPIEKGYIVYEVNALNLTGGHSGIDIDKNIDSAIKVLAHELANREYKLISIKGGEFRNSIPKNVVAIIASKEDIILKDERVSIKENKSTLGYIENGESIIKLFDSFAQGVRGFSKEFMVPSHSINLGVIRISDNELRVDCSARGMNNKEMKTLADETESLFKILGFKTEQTDEYTPWEPNIGTFANLVKSKMSKTYKNTDFKAIHAGLECGILIQKQKHQIEAVAIGPTIRYPHSLREECDVNSVTRISEVVYDIIEEEL